MQRLDLVVGDGAAAHRLDLLQAHALELLIGFVGGQAREVLVQGDLAFRNRGDRLDRGVGGRKGRGVAGVGVLGEGRGGHGAERERQADEAGSKRFHHFGCFLIPRLSGADFSPGSAFCARDFERPRFRSRARGARKRP